MGLEEDFAAAIEQVKCVETAALCLRQPPPSARHRRRLARRCPSTTRRASLSLSEHALGSAQDDDGVQAGPQRGEAEGSLIPSLPPLSCCTEPPLHRAADPSPPPLQVYALFKQVTVGECAEEGGAQPWAVQVEKRSKWDAWASVAGVQRLCRLLSLSARHALSPQIMLA